MEHLFYFLVLICLIIQVIFLIKKRYVWKLFKTVGEMIKNKNTDPKKIPKSFYIYGILNIICAIILSVGLFSSQYIWFLILLFPSPLTTKIRKKYLSASYIKTIINISILIFILVNKYFLHIDIINIIF